MEIQFLGGASEGQVMTLVASATEICTFGRARQRQVYVEHLITESHNLAATSRQKDR